MNKNILLLRDCAESLAPQNINSINKYRPADYILKEKYYHCVPNIFPEISMMRIKTDASIWFFMQMEAMH